MWLVERGTFVVVLDVLASNNGPPVICVVASDCGWASIWATPLLKVARPSNLLLRRGGVVLCSRVCARTRLSLALRKPLVNSDVTIRDSHGISCSPQLLGALVALLRLSGRCMRSATLCVSLALSYSSILPDVSTP